MKIIFDRWLDRLLVLSIAMLGFLVQSASAQNQEAKKLTIGDTAPPLKYAKWIQGAKPIIKIEKENIYVVEFWATWCGPCIAAMPHLSELAKKYAGKIEFIGTNVFERVGDKPYESSLPAVQKFVENQRKLEKMTYNVISDNNAQDMAKGWLDAAGIDGIPASFVISKGVISWIGHPLSLDSVLNAVHSGTFDIKVAKEKYESSRNPNEERVRKFQFVQKRYQQAETDKDYNKALAYVDSAIVQMPEANYVFMTDRFRILLDHFSEDEAMVYGHQVMKGNVGVKAITGFLAGRNDLSQKMKDFSVQIAKKMDVKYPMEMEVVAKLQARAGYYKEAAESQQKTIDMAIEQKKNKDMAQFLTDELINGYKKSLEEYKSKSG